MIAHRLDTQGALGVGDEQIGTYPEPTLGLIGADVDEDIASHTEGAPDASDDHAHGGSAFVDVEEVDAHMPLRCDSRHDRAQGRGGAP